MIIYYYNVDRLIDKKTYQFNFENVSIERQKKVERIKYEDKARQSLGAGILMEYIRKTENITSEIEVNKYNKPEFKKSKTHFNLSHSDKYAVAVTSKYPIGIDTENILRKTEFTMNERRVINSCFTPKEQEYVYYASADEEKLRRFFRVWTIKEAFVKMEGTGIIRPFYTFEINFDDEEPKILCEPECKITELRLGANNIIAVCHNRKDDDVKLIEVEEI